MPTLTAAYAPETAGLIVWQVNWDTVKKAMFCVFLRHPCILAKNRLSPAGAARELSLLPAAIWAATFARTGIFPFWGEGVL